MERCRMRLESRLSEDSVNYYLKFGQMILTFLGIIGILLWLTESPRRIKALGPAAAS